MALFKAVILAGLLLEALTKECLEDNSQEGMPASCVPEGEEDDASALQVTGRSRSATNHSAPKICKLGPGAAPRDCCLADQFLDKCEACMCIDSEAPRWCNRDQDPDPDGKDDSIACYA